jgi:hypothetical protein
MRDCCAWVKSAMKNSKKIVSLVFMEIRV